MHGDTIILAFEDIVQTTQLGRRNRIYRALDISPDLILRVSGRQWLVPSQSSEDAYIVVCTRSADGSGWDWTCTCPDATMGEPTAPRDGQCKHILAVIFMGEGRKRASNRAQRIANIIEEENHLLSEMGRLYERTAEHRQEWRLLVNAVLELNQITRRLLDDTISELHAEAFDFMTYQVKDEEAA